MWEYKYYHIIRKTEYFNIFNIENKDYAYINTIGKDICSYVIWRNYPLSSNPAALCKIILNEEQIQEVIDEYVFDADYKLYVTEDNKMIEVNFNADDVYDWYKHTYEKLYQYWFVTEFHKILKV